MIASREPPAAVAEAVRSLLREEPVGSPWIPAAPLGVPRVPAWLRPVAALGLAAASIFSLLYWDASRAAPGGAGAPGTNRPATEPGHPRSGWARKWLELGRAETASRVSAAAAGGWANGLETELAQAETEVHRLDSALLAEYFEEDLVEDFRELERSKRTLEMELQDL